MKTWESEHLTQITALKAEIEELKKNQEFNSAKYDDLVTDCEELKKINKLQEQEIMKMKSQFMKYWKLGVINKKRRWTRLSSTAGG